MIHPYCCICHVNMTRNPSHICDECSPHQKRPLLGKLFLWACLIGAAVAAFIVWM